MCNKPAVWSHVDSDKHKNWLEDAVKKSGLPPRTKVKMNPAYNWSTAKEQWWSPPTVGMASPPSSGESGKGAAAARSRGGCSASDLSMGPAASDSGTTAIVEKISDVSRQLQQLQDVSNQVDKVVAATCTIKTNCDNYSRTINMKVEGLSAKLDVVVTKIDKLINVVDGCVQTVATMRTELASRPSSIGCCGSSGPPSGSPQQQTMD